MPIVVFQGLLGEGETDSVIPDIEAFQIASEFSKVTKFWKGENTFESALLGHSQLSVQTGPLTIAALGWDPPEHSLHFRATLMSANDDLVQGVRQPLSPEDEKVVQRELARLNTSQLTFLWGEERDHGLVLERRGNLITVGPEIVIEQGATASLPIGDHENLLRRFIDDSVNLLSEQEFNQRRVDLGFEPVNLVWPWGQGERSSVDNMLLRVGYPWRIMGQSLALRGYARLSGFRPELLPMVQKIEKGVAKDLGATLLASRKTLAVLDFSPLAGNEHSEEKRFVLQTIGREIMIPVMEWAKEAEQPLWFVASNLEGDGLVARMHAPVGDRNHYPLDERSLTERKVTEVDLPKLLAVASQ